MKGRKASDGLKEVIRDYRRDQVIDVARRLFGERGTNIFARSADWRTEADRILAGIAAKTSKRDG